LLHSNRSLAFLGCSWTISSDFPAPTATMNCPSRTDAIVEDGMNQSPNAFAPDITTRSDFGQIANARLQRDHRVGVGGDATDTETVALQQLAKGPDKNGTSVFAAAGEGGGDGGGLGRAGDGAMSPERNNSGDSMASPNSCQPSRVPPIKHLFHRARGVLVKYGKFVGPGFMISVAYIDPGNYATAVAAGATYRFRLLFMVLASNIIAIFLQSLCTKLGTVTGMNLAENCKANFPPWLNYTLYFFAESAIIATDIAEVIGTAIALNLLLHIPLVAGCALSIVDVIVILFFYRPGRGSMRGLRLFEFFVALLVIGVVVCFCFQLSLVRDTGVGEVFRGYLPSKALVQGQGLYQACGILGATVMPHSLYLGSGLIQARLREFDRLNTPDSVIERPPHPESDEDGEAEAEEEVKYRPSISAIRSCLSYSIAEQAISLFTFALFVNSAILIVAGASLYGVTGAEEADLFGIHDLLSRTMAPVAGTIYALALLLSGISAGIVCTIAGQMVSEGQLSLKMKPWVRRLFTRSISVTPSIIIAGAVGREGLNAALNGSQVALSVILPFVTAPLIYLTCRNKYMTVATREGEGGPGGISMRNNWLTASIAVALWLLICVMNVSLLVLVGLGEVD
jgi:metal iron transporter